MAQALYRKYRSKSLGEIVGQTHVTDILTRSLAQGRIAHAYLLTGPRGVGKTSIARILAYEINQLPYDETATHLDIIEIDAASNNGVEDIRDLREKVRIAPVAATKKIYIIDEVHMLSKAAFNALLKTLEEPPEHAVFILATTDIDKLPATIISRTQRFSFRAISVEDAVRHLRHIADEERIKIDDSALELIALRGDGSFRDSISLLDQLRSLSDNKKGITRDLVEQLLGLAPVEQIERLLKAYTAKDLKTIVALLDESDRGGIQPIVLTSQLIQKVRRLIADKPQLLPLLDQLLEVAKSSQPNIKLLTVLGSHAAKPKTAALTAPLPEISAPLVELEKLKPSPKREKSLNYNSNGLVDASEANRTIAALDVPNSSPTTIRDNLQPESEPTSGLDVTLGAKPGEEGSGGGVSVKERTLDWDKLIEHTRQNFVAMYSVLSKCSHKVDGSTLTLYTTNTFYKKKLDDSKHRTNLSKALYAVGAGELAIETIPTPAPLKDSTAAAVAAIMGGGEEVSVDG